MIELLDLVRDMFVLAVTLVVPLAAAGVVGGLLGGLFVSYIGLQDQSIAALVRAASVVVALVVTGASMHSRAQAFASEAWSTLPALGQPEPAPIVDDGP